MDVDELISQVFRRRPIWDKRLKQHANRLFVDKCWKEIALEMNTEEHLLKKKWKYLRDQYTTELSKVTHPKSGSDEIVTCKWQYFKALSFLKDIIRPRQSSGNCSTFKTSNIVENIEQQRNSPDIEDKEDVVGSEDVEGVPAQEDNAMDNDEICAIANRFCKIEYEEDTPRTQNIGSHTTDGIKRRRKDGYMSSMVEIERRKLEILSQRNSKEEKEPGDEHSLFFKSLLPHVRKICPEQIFPFRARIQEVVQQFVYPTSYSAESTPGNSTKVSPCDTPKQSET